MFGAGGAARAVLWALAARGFRSIRVVNRTAGNAKVLAQSYPGLIQVFSFAEAPEAIKDANLAVNVSTLGMEGAPPLLADLAGLRAGATVCDIVYRPLETALLKQARALGFRAVDGLGMLFHQAVPGFERWFGIKPQVTAALRAHVLAVMAQQKSAA
jgi:shikimate dehydrogenase